MRKLILCSIIGLVFCSILQAGKKNNKSAQRIQKNKKKIGQPCNRFALDMYHQLSMERKGNLFFSSYSLYELLSMLDLGAEGETEKQIAKILYLQKNREKHYLYISHLHENLLSLGKSGISLLIANALFADKSQDISPEYQKELKKYYSAKIFSLDFRNNRDNACTKLNKWISAKTKGKINGMLKPDSIPDLISLYLVNAIYFKGDWRSKFKKRNTIRSSFNCLNKGKIEVPTMYQQNNYFYAENDEMQFLGMRYKGKAVSMGIVLPRKKVEFSKFEKEFDISKLQEIVTKASFKSVKVFLPKFKFGSDMKLAESLKSLGIVNAFEVKSANFSKICPDIYVNKVLQRAKIEVNETGATAFAATFADEECFGAPPKPKIFRANRPFLFFIQDRSNKTILFMGRVVKP